MKRLARTSGTLPLEAPMEFIGIDVHKVETQICVLTEQGEVIETRIRTERQRLSDFFGPRAPARVLLESATESEWVARCLEACGHEVVVADPNFAPMYATRSKKVKTDRRDARALAEACRLGAFRPAHRASDEQRRVRARLSIREALVRSRGRHISLVRALLRREGLRVADGATERFVARVAKVDVPTDLRAEIEPLLRQIDACGGEIEKLDKAIATLAKGDPRVDLLQTAPSVGPVTGAAFVAAIDNVERFQDGHQVAAYFGLVPSENSSGEKQRRGGITKAGPPRMRWLLVQVAWSLLRSTRASTTPLRTWATRIAAVRGKSVAVVALARKLSGVLFAMLRDGKPFQLPTSEAQSGVATPA
jgi:transposase